MEDGITTETVEVPMNDSKPKPKKEKRPKKRPKNAEAQPESSPPPLATELPEGTADAMDVDPPQEYAEPSLPAFPLPTAPNPPSKGHLAAQGADPAFLKADIIEPSVIQPLETVDISERMKTRLGELGNGISVLERE